ncbi:hypothetical protein RAD16_08795 [Bradyrhizobium sp. 18BD]
MMETLMLPLFATFFLATAWIAIPLVPAMIFHRVCPEMIIFASGKVPGTDLKLNAAGAVAVYFVVLFLLMYQLVGTATKDIANLGKPYWEITGRLYFLDGTRVVAPTDQLLRIMELKADPSNLSHNGSLVTLKIPEETARAFPTIDISFPETEWVAKLDLTETTIPWWKFWGHTNNKMKIDPLYKQIDVSRIEVNKLPRRGTYNSLQPNDRPDP